MLVFDRMPDQVEVLNGPQTRAAAVDTLLAATRREVAVLNADMVGTQAHPGELGLGWGAGLSARAGRRLIRDIIEDSANLFMVIDPRPGLHIVDLNDAFAAATFTNRRRVAGGKLFEIYPDNPDDPGADGVGNLFESLQRAARSGRPHEMPLQRYDVQDAEGRFVEKYWRPSNIPILDEHGRLAFLLHRAVEVPPPRV